MSSGTSYQLFPTSSRPASRSANGHPQAAEWEAAYSLDDRLDGAHPAAAPALPIGQDETETVWVNHDPETGGLRRVPHEAEALAGFRPVRRRLSTGLALLPKKPGQLVNGLPALSFSVLGVKDNVLLAPGLHVYVTELVVPYVGPPTEKLLGKRCPFCLIEFVPETRVVGHRCSDTVAYHHETAESHPDIPEKERLVCFEKVTNCLSCLQPVTLHEYLVWNPEEL